MKEARLVESLFPFLKTRNELDDLQSLQAHLDALK